jgi:hypothetical protein
MFKFGYAQAYVIRCGRQVYIGHTTQPLTSRLAEHKSHAKTFGRNSKLHRMLRDNDYNCTISHIQDIFYSVLLQAREAEGVWMDNYDSINNGLNSYRATITLAQKRKRIYEYGAEKVMCWNCDHIMTKNALFNHRRTKACRAIEMNSLKLIKMYL